mmetsp:Transcript_28456/g.77060  ORF Transcript_28456/g.77060 Transcript_28456/m.77060 type:complete len:299 (+) Transcript_28456:556-1452(+)
MNVRFGCRPRTSVDGATQRFVSDVLPLNGQRDGIFRVHALALGHSGRPRRRDPNGSGHPGQGPLAPINVVGIQIVGNVRGLPGPGLEGFQLVLGLTHVGVHVLKVAEAAPDSIPGIGVERIEALVDLDSDQDPLFGGGLGQLLVVLQGLNDGFRDHHVHAPLDTFHGNIKVGVVRGEDDGDVSRLEGLGGGFVGLGVHLIVCGKGLAGQVHVLVDVPDVSLHVGTDPGQFFAIHSAHSNAVDLLATTQIEHREGHDAGSLIAVGCLSTHVSGGVFTGSYHEDVHLAAGCHLAFYDELG